MDVFLWMVDTWLWFVVWSVAGWCYEMILFRFTQRKWVRRGFLFGPFCPIYGTGAMVFWYGLQWVPAVIRPAIPNIVGSIAVECVILFFIGGIVACALEYATATALEHIFHTRWWDYDKNWGNIKGRIAPIGFVAFGCFAAAVIELLQPFVVWVTNMIPDTATIIAAIACGVWLALDFTLTLIKLIRKKNVEKRNTATADTVK